MRKFNIEYKTLKNNIENNVIPYLDKIDTQEIMYHIVTTNLVEFKNDNDKLLNGILVGIGSIIIGLSSNVLTLPIWGLLGPTAVGIGIVNYFCARSTSAKLDTISGFLSMYLISFCLPLANTIIQAITSTTPVRIAVPRLDSTPEIPTLARTEVNAANTAERMAYIIHDLRSLFRSACFFSTMRNMPTARIAVAISLTARLEVSPKQTIASNTVNMVLDLSMGTTLLMSPTESALK